MTTLDSLLPFLDAYPSLKITASLAVLAFFAFIANFVIKKILLRIVLGALKLTPLGRDGNKTRLSVIPRLANIVPAIVVIMGIPFVPSLPETLSTIIQNVAKSCIILFIVLSIAATLDIINQAYSRRPQNASRSIKGYIQIIKIALYCISTILIISTLIDKSPVILLSGLGALAAVLMLIFQDTILSFVASIQISSSDMIRVGDWIEMPNLNADGDVIDIALHTVKVQNWDKTITTIPTRRLISDPFKNWRGMFESGGRRIKRAIYIDQNSISFLTPDDKNRLMRMRILRDYLNGKEQEITEWNANLGDAQNETVNTRRITNIGTFRAYVLQYLRTHAGINQNMTMIVRQLSPGAEGLPIEIYAFTSSTAWVNYEGIQSDIFDHLYAILPEFGLKAFQSPTGADFQKLAHP